MKTEAGRDAALWAAMSGERSADCLTMLTEAGANPGEWLPRESPEEHAKRLAEKRKKEGKDPGTPTHPPPPFPPLIPRRLGFEFKSKFKPCRGKSPLCTLSCSICLTNLTLSCEMFCADTGMPLDDDAVRNLTG